MGADNKAAIVTNETPILRNIANYYRTARLMSNDLPLSKISSRVNLNADEGESAGIIRLDDNLCRFFNADCPGRNCSFGPTQNPLLRGHECRPTLSA